MSTATFKPLSHQFDATREEIVADFRARIQQHKRSKLSKAQLEELIDLFITSLESLTESDAIQQLCQAEISLLEEGYPPASVAKNYLPKYRQAIRRSLALRDRFSCCYWSSL